MHSHSPAVDRAVGSDSLSRLAPLFSPPPSRSYARLLAVLENASFVPYSSSLAALASPSPRQSLLFNSTPPAPLAAAASALSGLGPGVSRPGIPQPSPPASPAPRPWDPALPLGDRPLTVRIGVSVHTGASPSGSLGGAHGGPHSRSSTPSNPSPLGPGGGGGGGGAAAAGGSHTSPRVGPGSGGSAHGNQFFGPGAAGDPLLVLPHPASPQPLKPRRSPSESPRISRQSVPVSPAAMGVADPGDPPFLSLEPGGAGPGSPGGREDDAADRRARAAQGGEGPSHAHLTAQRVLVRARGRLLSGRWGLFCVLRPIPAVAEGAAS